MTYLPIKYKRDGYKLVGASLPLQVHNYLTLFTLAKGSTKSRLLTNIINNWICEQKKSGSEERLIRDIIRRCNILWNKRRKDKGMSFKAYKEGLCQEFTDKGLTEIQVESILKGLKDR